MKSRRPVRKVAVDKPRTVVRSRASASRVRQRVRDLLAKSASYRAMTADRRRDVARDMSHVAAYLVDPHGLLGQEFENPLLSGVVAAETAAGQTGAIRVPPDTIQVSPQAMDELVQAVDFPSFVDNLIDGVFGAIVNASIQQMEEYAALIAAVSKSVDDFIEDNITDSAGRDSLTDAFPDAFCPTGVPSRLGWSAKAAPSSLSRIAAAIGLREPVIDPRNPRELKRVVAAARRRLARNRQQVLATMILMGINRIVETTDSTSKLSRGLPR
jgi:hypothetical protein